MITITRADGKFNWAYRGVSEPLAHRHYDTFELPDVPDRLLPDRLAISFSTDREGDIANLAAPFEPLVKDIVFARIPAGDCTNPVFRQHCTGTFIRQGVTTVVVRLDSDGQLTLTIARQPAYKLRPYRQMRLRHRGTDGLSTRRWRELDSNFGYRARQAWVPT